MGHPAMVVRTRANQLMQYTGEIFFFEFSTNSSFRPKRSEVEKPAFLPFISQQISRKREAIHRVYMSIQPNHSTKDFSLASAWSHSSEMRSRYSFSSSIGFGSSSKRLSRPVRTQRTIFVLSRTRRCLVIA